MRGAVFALTVALVLAAPASRAQTRDELLLEVQKLKVQNLLLKSRIDSLRRAAGYRALSSGTVSSLDGTGVVDTWDLLVDGGGFLEDIFLEDDKPEDAGKCLYERRLEELDSRLMIEYDDRLGGYIESYAMKRRKRMERVLKRYEGWRDYFRGTFAKYGVPEDVSALCIVESAVTSQALSHAGAAGMWQIMPGTAAEYGLKTGMTGDERYDVEKSTVVAARVLASLHRFYDDWPLAICAYNCGSGNVQKAIRKAGGRRDFWSIYDYLPAETRAYLPSFIAVLYYMNYEAEETEKKNEHGTTLRSQG